LLIGPGQKGIKDLRMLPVQCAEASQKVAVNRKALRRMYIVRRL